MKLPETKIETVASKNDVRYYLNGIYADTVNGVYVATDGHCLAMVPIPDFDADAVQGDDPCFIIPNDALKNARKRGKDGGCGSVHLTGGNGSVNWADGELSIPMKNETVYNAKPIDAKYPDYQKVIPEPAPVTICLNAELLARVQAAICNGEPGIRLEIRGPNDSIRITPVGAADNDGRVGVVMPMRD